MPPACTTPLLIPSQLTTAHPRAIAGRRTPDRIILLQILRRGFGGREVPQGAQRSGAPEAAGNYRFASATIANRFLRGASGGPTRRGEAAPRKNSGCAMNFPKDADCFAAGASRPDNRTREK